MKMSSDLSTTISDGTYQVAYEWISKLRRTDSDGQFGWKATRDSGYQVFGQRQADSVRTEEWKLRIHPH